MQTVPTQPAQVKQQQYFDLQTKGIGYLDRIRTVNVRKGNAFLACTVSALHGDSSDVNVTKFDCKVSSESAQNIVLTLKEACDQKKKVIIGFMVSDTYPEAFEVVKEGQKEQRLCIKGRLLHISFAKIDGVLVDLSEFQKPASEPLAA